MRYQDQQNQEARTDVVKSDPVPVPPPDADAPAEADRGAEATARDDRGQDAAAYDDRGQDAAAYDDRGPDAAAYDRTDRVSDEGLVDRGDFEDPVAVDELTDAERGAAAGSAGETAAADQTRDDTGFGQADADRDAAATGPVGAEAEPTLDQSQQRELDRDLDRTEATPAADVVRTDYDREHVVEPAAQPTVFGAATVGGATAAAAMAGQRRDDASDVRDEDTARPEDGTVESRASETGAAAQPAGSDVGTPLAGTAATTDATADAAVGQPIGEVAPTGQLMPGDVPAEPVAALLSADASQNFRDRWREIQLRFVDEPRAAATDAQQLVEEAVDSLARALAEQKDNLGGWSTGDTVDTENLRVAVRRYRDFLDRLLGL